MTEGRSSAPRLSIAPIGVAKREGDGWRTTWSITNSEADAVRVVAAIAPHPKFRGETPLDREIRAKASTQFSLVVQTPGEAGSEVDNAFVVVQVERGEDRWRFLARLRVPLGDAGKPEPRIETITSQRVGFSGEL
jgi:hypothetical protein